MLVAHNVQYRTELDQKGELEVELVEMPAVCSERTTQTMADPRRASRVDSCVDLDVCTASLVNVRGQLAVVSARNGPVELTCLDIVPCATSGLGRIVAPPGVLTTHIVQPLIPATVLPGYPLHISLALCDAYPATHADELAVALDAVERRLVVVAALINRAPSLPEPQRLLLPVSMSPNPGERTLCISLAVPVWSTSSNACIVALEELSLAGVSLLQAPLPSAVRVGVSHDRRAQGAAWRAAQVGDVPALLAALLDGGSTGEADGDESCLHIAIRNGQSGVVAALLRVGAAAHMADDHPKLLSFAVTLGKAECVAALLVPHAAGIDVNAGQGRSHGTALHAAASVESNACLRLLLAAPGIDLDALDKKGESALHVAAAAGANEALVMLLAAGASPHARGLGGETPLHRATTAECVATLIATPGVDVNAAMPLGYTPLHRVVSLGPGIFGSGRHVACLKALLSAPGLDLNPRDIAGETPLHVAAAWAVRVLLESGRGVDVGAVNLRGQTPRRLAEIRRDDAAVLLFKMHEKEGSVAQRGTGTSGFRFC